MRLDPTLIKSVAVSGVDFGERKTIVGQALFPAPRSVFDRISFIQNFEIERETRYEGGIVMYPAGTARRNEYLNYSMETRCQLFFMSAPETCGRNKNQEQYNREIGIDKPPPLRSLPSVWMGFC